MLLKGMQIAMFDMYPRAQEAGMQLKHVTTFKNGSHTIRKAFLKP
jgi:hypothetical protein